MFRIARTDNKIDGPMATEYFCGFAYNSKGCYVQWRYCSFLIIGESLNYMRELAKRPELQAADCSVYVQGSYIRNNELTWVNLT